MITHVSWHLGQAGYLHPESPLTSLSFLICIESIVRAQIIRKMPLPGGQIDINVFSLSPELKQIPLLYSRYVLQIVSQL